MASNKYHVIKLGEHGSSYVEVKPATIMDKAVLVMTSSVGPSGLSLIVDKQEALELIAALADVAGLDPDNIWMHDMMTANGMPGDDRTT